MTERPGVIFDMDGVLVDSSAAHYESWLRLGKEAGFTMSQRQFEATFGRTSREILVDYWPELATSSERVQLLDRRKEELFREILAADFRPMEGALQLVADLSDAGFALAVGSSGPPENVALVIEHLGIRPHLGAVVTGMDVTRGKPDPQVFLLAAEKLGIPPTRCLVVEDAASGVQAAKAAGMKCLGLASPPRDPAVLASADRVVTSLAQVTAQDVRQMFAAG